jgi:hypothetical protein
VINLATQIGSNDYACRPTSRAMSWTNLGQRVFSIA